MNEAFEQEMSAAEVALDKAGFMGAVSLFWGAEMQCWVQRLPYDDYLVWFEGELPKVVDREFYEDLFRITTAYAKRMLVEQGFSQEIVDTVE